MVQRKVKGSDGADLSRTVRQITIKHVSSVYATVMNREGATVLLDAGIDLHLGALEQIAGARYNVDRVKAFEALDGAIRGVRVERTMAPTTHLSRSDMYPGGKVNHDLLAAALRVVGEWAAETPASASIGLATYLVIERAITDALAGRGPQVVIDALHWATADAPGVISMPGLVRLSVGHFGALRGLDRWEGKDIVTLGDPRPNLDDVRMERDVLRTGETLNARVLAVSSEELKQAHGRIRAPGLKTSRKALALGAIVPGGWSLHGYFERTVQLAAGRLTPVAAMTREELAGLIESFGGSQKEFAEAARVPFETLKSYLAAGSKRRQIPARAAQAFRAVAPLEKLDPISSPERDRFAQLVTRVGGPTKAARRLDRSVRAVYQWLNGERPIPANCIDALSA
jgi:hypothetical protein